MSRLDPSVIALDKGLNLQTAKILAPAGSALSSLNYEQVDFQGQKRIDGYARYDGNTLPALDEIYYISDSDLVDFIEKDGALFLNDVFFGVIVDDSIIDEKAIVVYNKKLLETVPHESSVSRYPTDYESQYEAQLLANNVLRDRVGSLPGAVSALHWFNDRLYAVSDLSVVLVAASSSSITVNDKLQNISLDDTRTILRVVGTAEGTLVYLSDGPITSWIENNFTAVRIIYKNDSSLNTTITNFTPSVPMSSYPASFFEARNEQQVEDEDADYSLPISGWKFDHLGWEVKFEDGNIPYGGFTSINQNRQGVGIEGPTSTAGNNGRPIALFQKVSISNALPQVNGWKSSTTPTSYNLDPAALLVSDTSYIYADAYVEWESDTQTITTPDTTPTLTERLATSTIELET